MRRNRMETRMEDKAKKARRLNHAAIEAWIHDKYPIKDQERAALPPGVRLARHVPLAECQECPLAYQDHTENWKWPTKICLKEVRK